MHSRCPACILRGWCRCNGLKEEDELGKATKIAEVQGAKSLCIPFEQPELPLPAEGTCREAVASRPYPTATGGTIAASRASGSGCTE